jgi:hypothetical protein
MRWEQLFDDLEAQWDAEQRRDLDYEVADRTRRERASIGLYDRLAAAVGTRVLVRLGSGGAVPVSGAVADVGQDWLLLHDGQRPVLVPIAAIAAVSGLGERAAGGSAVGKRFALGYALRGLSRDRAVVALTDSAGVTTTGTIDGVGSDCFDLSEHASDEPRRPENITGRRLVPFSAVVSVRPA